MTGYDDVISADFYSSWAIFWGPNSLYVLKAFIGN